ncbi:MAG: UDP-N-acetylmuramoyl-L-alanine--D-glutamate ligase, partial [Deltaproteobacteria bacterium CG11_big_fil_rev_8_21_14_0_20_49_13]
MELKGKKILIVGFGRSGAAAARYCLGQGAKVTVTDTRTEESFDISALASMSESWQAHELALLRTFFGGNPAHLFEEADIIVPSPGVPLELEGIRRARAKKIPIVGEMELVLDKIKAPIIAITGTNGKSTVTTIIGEILKDAGKDVLVGGNLGTPLIELLEGEAGSERQEAGKTDFVVLEVSSYQLEISPNFHPQVALLLNITPDHLDRYNSMEDYIKAKALIDKNLTEKDVLIYNGSDELVAKIAAASKAKKLPFSLKDQRPFKDIDLNKAIIKGAHNKENLLAALFAVNALGIEPKVAQRVFEKFKGLPHRNQFVREIDGI